MMNELVILLVLYCLLLLIQDVVPDGEVLEKLGLGIIAITVLNFIINSVPLFFQLRLFSKVQYANCVKRKMKQRMLRQLELTNFKNRLYLDYKQAS